MRVIRPALAVEDVEQRAATWLDRAIERARLTNERVAVAIGYSPAGESHVRAMRAGSQAFTLRHLALLAQELPAGARELVAVIAQALVEQTTEGDAVSAYDRLVLAALEVVRLSVPVLGDRKIDATEAPAVRAALTTLRRCLDELDARLPGSARGAS